MVKPKVAAMKKFSHFYQFSEVARESVLHKYLQLFGKELLFKSYRPGESVKRTTDSSLDHNLTNMVTDFTDFIHLSSSTSEFLSGRKSSYMSYTHISKSILFT